MNKKRKLRTWVKYALVGLITILIVVSIELFLKNDMEAHIERVSEKCALQGYGIEVNYTKEGDEYYVCKK